MTVFNFPDTAGKPTDGTFTWTAPNGLLYSWDGDAWRTIGGGGDGNASITITDDLSTIPAPDAGDLAWHTIEARMYIYYQDDDSQQWVDASPAGDGGGDSLWTSGSNVVGALTPTTDDDVWVNGYVLSGDAVYARNGNSSGKVFVGQGNDSNNTEVFSVTNTGDLSAAAGTFSGTISHASYGNYGFQSAVNTTSEFCATTIAAGTSSAGNLNRLPFKITYDDGVGSATKFAVGADGTVRVGGTISNAADTSTPNITLKANGTSDFRNRMEIYRETDTSNLPLMHMYSDVGGTKSSAFVFKAGGQAEKPGGGSWSATSDARAKEDVTDYSSGLDELKKLTPRSYRYIGNPITYIGLVAQEAEGAMPELVTKGEGTLPDGTEVDDFRTLDQTPLTFALINAVKEMATRIEALEAEVQSLKGGS